jgi:hypothetical protein
MKSSDLYKALDHLGLEWEICESFEGVRVVNIVVEEVDEEGQVYIPEQV